MRHERLRKREIVHPTSTTQMPVAAKTPGACHTIHPSFPRLINRGVEGGGRCPRPARDSSMSPPPTHHLGTFRVPLNARGAADADAG
jgi:hypothetical protein